MVEGVPQVVQILLVSGHHQLVVVAVLSEGVEKKILDGLAVKKEMHDALEEDMNAHYYTHDEVETTVLLENHAVEMMERIPVEAA